MGAAVRRDRRGDPDAPPLQVYTPQRLSLPSPRSYVTDLWMRRQFAVHLARTELRSQHVNTVFGQLWLVLNPLLLATVYFVLVEILRDGERGPVFFAHLVGSLFVFHFFSTAVSQGARSVTRSGRLILNTAFPRTLLPLSSVLTALVRFVPMLLVYAAVHVVAGVGFGVEMLWALPVFLEIAVFATGVTLMVAAGHVYFRDLTNFLPYVLRIWLYVSPVLYLAEEVPDNLRQLLVLNPMFPMLAAWSDAVIDHQVPQVGHLGAGAAWAIGALLVGAVFFVAREREFAVRL